MNTPMDFMRWYKQEYMSPEPQAWKQLTKHVQNKRSECECLNNELQSLQSRISVKKEQIEVAKDKLKVLQKNRLKLPKK